MVHRILAVLLATAAFVSAMSGGAGAATIVGKEGSDAPPSGTALYGTPEADTIYGDPQASMGPVTAVKRVSTSSSGAEAEVFGASGYQPGLAVSPDGTSIVFPSKAINLVTGTTETDFSADLYHKNLATGLVTRLTHPKTGIGLDGSIFSPVFSPDGTRIAFSSPATNLLPQGEDTNDLEDIFVVTIADGSIRRVSTTEPINGVEGEADGPSQKPVFSPDGTKLAFASTAHLTISADSNGKFDIFIKDIGTPAAPGTGSVQRVSSYIENGLEVEAMNGDSYDPVFSPDGTKIAFASAATTLLPNNADTNGFSDIFVRDIAGGTIERISLGMGGAQLEGGESIQPVFSPDGTKIAFVSKAITIGDIPGNGLVDHIYVRTLATGETHRISVAVDSGLEIPADGDSADPVFSPDGTKLAFQSKAHNLAGGSSQIIGLYIAQSDGQALRRLSTTAADAAGTTTDANGSFTAYGRFLPDGRGIAYVSDADNLVTGDGNSLPDVFVATLSPPNPGDDGILAGDGADTIIGGPGNDTILGEGGEDGAVYPGPRRRYLVSADSGGAQYYVIDLLGEEGDDLVVSSTEKLIFDDTYGTLAEMANPALNDKPPVAEPIAPFLVKAGVASPAQQVLATDPEGDPLTVTLATAPVRGTVTILPGGGFTYTANQNATVGSDSFTLKVADPYDGLKLAAHALAPVTVKIALDLTGGANGDVLAGGDQNDLLSGGAGDDTLSGSGGDDVLKGGTGVDTLKGGAGKDRLEGGSGGDRLDGGTGADMLIGGTGDDVYVVDDKADVVTELANQGYDSVEASVSYVMPANVEMLLLKGGAKISATGNPANAGQELLVGNGADNVLNGLAGDDLFVDSGGRDTIRGGAGADWLSYIGSARAIAVDLGRAESGGNVLSSIENVIGSPFADRIIGNGADNVLQGGKGRDTMTGKGGKDTFRFAGVNDSPASAPDTIADFKQAQGDRIDLRSFATKSGIVQRLTYIGTDKFGRRKGEVRFASSALLVDVTGDAKADFKVTLTGVKALKKTALQLR